MHRQPVQVTHLGARKVALVVRTKRCRLALPDLLHPVAQWWQVRHEVPSQVLLIARLLQQGKTKDNMVQCVIGYH